MPVFCLCMFVYLSVHYQSEMIDSQLQNTTDKNPLLALTHLSFSFFPSEPKFLSFHSLPPRNLATEDNTECLHDLINLCTAPPAQVFAVYHCVKTFRNIVGFLSGAVEMKKRVM